MPSPAIELRSAGITSLGLVNQLLNLADGRVVDRPDCFAATRAFNGAFQAHSLVTDVEVAATDGAVCLGPDIIKFVRHACPYTSLRTSDQAQAQQHARHSAIQNAASRFWRGLSCGQAG